MTKFFLLKVKKTFKVRGENYVVILNKNLTGTLLTCKVIGNYLFNMLK